MALRKLVILRSTRRVHLEGCMSPPQLTRGLRQGRSWAQSGSKTLHPGAQLDFPGPGAALLAVQLQVGLRDSVGIE